jgi:Putative  PD-(D/E)XK family member, (DUF4420)
MSTALRELIDEHWSRLDEEAASAPNRMRISGLPVGSANGALAAGVDHDGHRHLLVPLAAQKKVRPGLDGPVLTLGRRALEDEDSYQTYADLGCLRSDFDDVFTGLCADVLKATEALPANPVKALYMVLDQWKALFQAKGAPLGAEQLAGLFGELTVLARLLGRDSGAHRLWKGPEGHRHDFIGDTGAVEVKVSTTSEERRARIHGLDQLEPPALGPLFLVWFRLERSSAHGQRLVDLVQQAVRLCEDESALLGLLSVAGYHNANAEVYRDISFTIAEERWYEVNASFPKLVGHDLSRAGIPISVLDVQYTIDLSNEPPTPSNAAQVNGHLAQMIQESP